MVLTQPLPGKRPSRRGGGVKASSPKAEWCRRSVRSSNILTSRADHRSAVRGAGAYPLVDDRRDLATGTPRVVRGRLLPCLEHSGGDKHQRTVRHLPLGSGFSTSQDFNGDIALIACFASAWTPAMVRRWHADPFGFMRPWNEVPALLGTALTSTRALGLREEADAQVLAEKIVAHLERCRIHFLQEPPARTHSTPGPRATVRSARPALSRS